MSTYIAAAQTALHDAMRTVGKDPAVKLTPQLEAAYLMLVLTTGVRTTLADVHDAWAVARFAGGVREHADMVPFGEMDRAQIERDRPYLRAIRVAAATLMSASTL